MSTRQPLAGRLPSPGIVDAAEPTALSGPGQRYPVGARYCHGCGYEPCVMAQFDGRCSGAGPKSPFLLGYLSLDQSAAVLDDKPGWTTKQRCDFLDGVQFRARVERSHLLAAAMSNASAGETP
jgi:hypothetical protein